MTQDKGQVPAIQRYEDHVAALVEAHQHTRIAELEAQLSSSGFTAADMATASAQGFRDGVASVAANAGEPRNAIDRDALIDAIAQGLHGTWHCTRVWEAWHVGTMSQDDFEPVDESETPTEIADAVLALLAAPPTAQAQGWRPLIEAPFDEIVLVAAEFDGPGDWRIKCGYLDKQTTSWRVFGASWEPTRWMPLPPPPTSAEGVEHV